MEEGRQVPVEDQEKETEGEEAEGQAQDQVVPGWALRPSLTVAGVPEIGQRGQA